MKKAFDLAISVGAILAFLNLSSGAVDNRDIANQPGISEQGKNMAQKKALGDALGALASSVCAVGVVLNLRKEDQPSSEEPNPT